MSRCLPNIHEDGYHTAPQKKEDNVINGNMYLTSFLLWDQLVCSESYPSLLQASHEFQPLDDEVPNQSGKENYHEGGNSGTRYHGVQMRSFSTSVSEIQPHIQFLIHLQLEQVWLQMSRSFLSLYRHIEDQFARVNSFLYVDKMFNIQHASESKPSAH